MKTPVPLVLAAALAALSTTAAMAQPDDAFVPLFNGKDLSGWHNINCAPGTFTARDGLIASTGKPICEIRTERMYENFVLELEYQHLEAGGNAGLFVWADALPARGQPFLRAIEIQILDGRESANYTSHGDVFAIHGAVLTPDRPHPGGWMRSLPSERRAKPAGQWNHYRVTANQGRITLAVNGKAVSGGYDISPRKGYIALESEGAPTLFRNLRIRELPAPGTLAPSQVAQAHEGFVSLYNGLDLTGWREAGPGGAHWTAHDWTLRTDGRGGALVSAADYGDIVLMTDWRVPEDAQSGGGAARLPAANTEVPGARVLVVPDPAAAGAKPGAWNRSVFTIRGGTLTVAVNGATMAGAIGQAGAAPRGPLALGHRGQPLEFANIFVKPLP